MNDYPDEPGHRGVEASIEAAEAIASATGRLQALALAAITAAGAAGLTADELAVRVDCTRWTIQPRTTELRHKGLIVDSGLRRSNVTGKRAIVWVLPEHRQADAA